MAASSSAWSAQANEAVATNNIRAIGSLNFFMIRSPDTNVSVLRVIAAPGSGALFPKLLGYDPVGQCATVAESLSIQKRLVRRYRQTRLPRPSIPQIDEGERETSRTARERTALPSALII